MNKESILSNHKINRTSLVVYVVTFYNTTIRIHCNYQNVSIILRIFTIGWVTWSQFFGCRLKENHKVLLLVIIRN